MIIVYLTKGLRCHTMQIDARILKAVAIEHPKDADLAAAIVISEIVPKFYPDLSDHPSSLPHNNKTPIIKVPDNNNGTCTFESFELLFFSITILYTDENVCM